jgi:hypothetical protein
LYEPTVIAAIIGLVGTLLAVIIPIWLSARRVEPPQPNPTAHVVVPIVPQGEKPSPAHQREPFDQKGLDQTLTLDEILDLLELHRQRVSFGAVAGVLGRDPQSLFKGYVRSPRTAWVVNKSTGLPTGTKPADYPPGLFENVRVIDTPEDLSTWLREHH